MFMVVVVGRFWGVGWGKRLVRGVVGIGGWKLWHYFDDDGGA